MRSLPLIALALAAGCGFAPSGLVPGGSGPDGSVVAPDAAAERDGAPTVDAAPSPDAPPDAAPIQCPAGYVAFGTGSYRQVSTVATWDRARADCLDDDPSSVSHTHLVVLSGPTEHAGVRAIFAGPKLWLGLSDRVTTGTWRWVTLQGTGYPPTSGPPWKSGQPNDGGGGSEDCVVMEADGEWDDRQCANDTEEYVCECDTYPEVAAQSDP